MDFVRDLEIARKEHQTLLATDFNDKQALSSACMAVTSSLRHLISDIREHAARGSGPRRKTWHEIVRELSKLSDEARFLERNKGAMMKMLGVEKDYDRIKMKIQEMGAV